MADAFEHRRFRAHFAGQDNSQGTAFIANLVGAPDADIGAFVCLAHEEHLGHVLEMPINTDIPPLNQEVMILAPRNAEVAKCGGIGTAVIARRTEVSALHKRYTLLNGPCFEMPVGTDNQASGSPIICAINGAYADFPFACGILSNSDLPKGAHPLTPPEGNWRTLAALLFPTLALQVRWRTLGQPLGEVSIAHLVNERVVKNIFNHPLDIHIEQPPFAREFPQINVVSQQWNSLNLPD